MEEIRMKENTAGGELIDGVRYEAEKPELLHQQLCFGIGRQLVNYAEENKEACFVLPFPVRVKMNGEENTVLQPDLSLVFDPRKLCSSGINGAPDLVVEVIAPETAWRDRFTKLAKYMNGGVREYWMVDGAAGTVIVYEREALVIPMTYTFDDKVPVGVLGRACRIDFQRIYKRILPFEEYSF